MPTVTNVGSVSGYQPGTHLRSLALLASLFFMWGFVSVLNDVLIPHLKAVFVMNYVETMLIQFSWFLAYFLLSIPASKLIERFGYKTAIVIGLAVMAAGCLGFIPAAMTALYPVFLCALFVLAGGVTLLQVAANPYVAVLGPPESSSIRLNLVQAFNSFGAFVAPSLGGYLILSNTTTGNVSAGQEATVAERLADAQSVQIPYFGIALVLLAIAAVIMLAKLPKVPTHPENEEERNDRIGRHSMLILGVIAIFLYVGAEVSIGSFLINYIISPHVSVMTSADAAGYVSFYWGGAMVGRFIGSFLMRWIRPPLLLGFSAIAACVLVTISITAGGSIAMWTVLAVGLCNSIMFPVIFSLAIKGLGPLTGRGSGYLIMACSGGGVLPLIQGALADSVGIAFSFAAPALCYVFVLYFAMRAYGRDAKFTNITPAAA
jgi:FHS family L-fucose permease-like MFS transporter